MTKTNKKFLIAVLTALMVVVTTLACFIGFNAVPKQAKAEENEPLSISSYKSEWVDLTGDTLANKTIYHYYSTVFNVYFDEEKTEYLNFQCAVGKINYYIDGEAVGGATLGFKTPFIYQCSFTLGETISLVDYDEEDVTYTIDLTRPIYEISKSDGTLTTLMMRTYTTQYIKELEVGDDVYGQTIFFANPTECCGSTTGYISFGVYTLTFDAYGEGSGNITVYDESDGGASVCELLSGNSVRIEKDCSCGETCEWIGFYIPEDGKILGTAIGNPDEEVLVDLEGGEVLQIYGENKVYITYEVEEPEEPEQVPEDTPTEVPGDDNLGQTPEEPTEKPTDDNNVDKGDKDNKQDKNDVTEDTFDFEDAIDWATDNVALVICISTIVILFVALILKNKRG